MGAVDDRVSEDCTDCGACCFGDGARYLGVPGSDHGRLGFDNDSLTVFIGNRCYMRLVDRHCAALTVQDPAPRFGCSVYALRPETCRHLQRGSDECLEQRGAKLARAAAAAPSALVAGLAPLEIPADRG